jgi:2-iminobutanoate/2-iminopropanoate deaminase
MTDETRRNFLTKAAVAAPVAALLSGSTAAGERRVLKGPPNRPFSRAVIHDQVVYVSGSIGRDPETGKLPPDFEAQCRNVFEQMKSGVEAAGSSMGRVLKCSCFLTDVGDFGTMNELFGKYFPKQPPARSTVVVKELVVEGAKVEIDCVAAL